MAAAVCSAHPPFTAKCHPNLHFHVSNLNLGRSRSSAQAFVRRRRGSPGVFLKLGVEEDGEEDDLRRRRFLLFLVALSSSTGLSPCPDSHGKSKGKNPYDEKRLLEQNKRIQRENRAPDDFPSFIREGFQVKVVTSDNYVRKDSGLIYKDFELGSGDCPLAGQQVIFHYIGYNESGRRIDSTYMQGSPAKVRMGTNTLIPGFEEGIRDMKPGGKRRIVIPPELGPPVGPSTFFSSKQFEVFDVELLDIQNCQRRTIGFYSDVVCN
ncbi:hypothetical protein MLD38_023749 [Melastoma candidum]|uniref:Uncharacterized protein n=1 Tax=Melastoma candidum TaxID=119954 RepID=A0ACB9NQB9_9MYRT|nr:hypothetical protein MLD38_023749 [Melastoma candidum]